MRFYLDACAVLRLADEKLQIRVHEESKAVEQLLLHDLLGDALWVASNVLRLELSQNPNEMRRSDALGLVARARTLVVTTDEINERGRFLAGLGFGPFDALHIACAEAATVDYLVTTDDRMIRYALRGIGSLRVRLVNPIDCIREVRTWPQLR